VENRDETKEQLFRKAEKLRRRIAELEASAAEREHGEEVLRKAAHQWSATFDAIRDAVCLLDLDAKVMRCNRAFRDFVGIPYKEIIGHPVWEMIHGTSEPPEDSPFIFMRLSLQRETGVYQVRDRWFHVAVDPQMDTRDNLAGAVHIMTDITERKHAEEEKEKIRAQLLQMQKMEAVGTLASGVAHDFNNQLTAIQGYTDLALMALDEEDPVFKDLKQIRMASRRAAGLTRQLLLFSRKQRMELAPIDINATIEDMLKMLQRLIGEDIAIHPKLEPDLWNVQGDAGKIEQVLLNLVVNARDAMPSGGRITIKTKNIVFDEEHCRLAPETRSGRFVCLSVEDQGVGMEKKTLEHIFEPFFSTKEAGKGTGLGLSVVYGIVKQHDGWIHVYSEPGKGSIFRVYLAAFSAKLQKRTEESISLSDLRGGGERILMVEDEEGVREFAAKALRECGYVIFEAAGAKEALQIFDREAGNFRLLFSDVVLSDQSGLELAEKFLSRKPELQVLLSSGYTDHKSQWPIISEKGFHYLEKPYFLRDLLRAVKRAMEAG
jgi:PAS domain S-box-containing protein